ncbi:MAG: acetate kinase [Candidatus Marinimicrobia bacterium]|nr:acetate kinase [Candidatus Neomarinimicrobiota bacterium]MCF7829448.1 acetate kinase [Candidatus Neomarinimicrobiota bacterium]MCF7880934.1 acetate kinase [Candidatus Neomarinimicrobiota bacterium]
MKVLVLNCGSSSVKYQLFDMDDRSVLARGQVDRIGMKGAVLSHTRHDDHKVKMAGEIIDHQTAIEYILAILISENHGVLEDREEIDAVGHRVVHGGEKFKDSVVITKDVVEKLQEFIDLAPLHNPNNLKGINACHQLLRDVPMVAVFDTAFHSTMPDYSYLYGLPYVLYKRYGVRRYGFHGTSHYYVSRRARDIVGKEMEDLKIITCHLGNGCSITAVDGGESVDTSMGFTPVEGLLMGTRSGDVDPALVLHLISKEELTINDMNTLLNKHSGLQGVSGVSSDMREIIEAVDDDHERARIALDIFTYRLKKYISAYYGVLGGLDVIVFTGGIGENSPRVRGNTVDGLSHMGIGINGKKNEETVGIEGDITADDADVRTLVIPTNEELVIAIDTEKLVSEME